MGQDAIQLPVGYTAAKSIDYMKMTKGIEKAASKSLMEEISKTGKWVINNGQKKTSSQA